MQYIHSISSVSIQNSFNQEGFSNSLVQLADSNGLILPQYKEWIAPMALRRMSPILKSSVSAANACIKNSPDFEIEGIVVGTSLGCLSDTETFLNNINQSGSQAISPSAFIQSTHNAVAGQISLLLGNHSYNMTHSHDGLSFELALMDAMLLSESVDGLVLVGGADEYIPFLEEIKGNWGVKKGQWQSGATFLTLGKRPSSSGVLVAEAIATQAEGSIDLQLREILHKLGWHPESIGLILSNCDLSQTFPNARTANYLEYTGYYPTAPALAFHIAYDQLVSSPDGSHRALVVNQICTDSLGIICLEKS